MNTPDTPGDPRRWLALPVLLTGAFLPPLDFYIVNVALPSIREGLHADAAQLQFVISAYAATYAVCLITGGRLGDQFGRRLLFLAGIVGFTLASLLCGLAWSPHALLAGRMLQGAFAAALAPQVLASIRVMFPTAEQPKALGLYAATFGLAGTLGQILGGVLISAHLWGWGWQLIFLVNLPVGLVAFIGGLLWLRESRSPHAVRLDLGGMALLSLAMILLVYPLVEGREQGWPAWTYLMLAASLVVFVAFWRFESRVLRNGRTPLVDVTLFHQRDFSLGIVVTLGFYLMSAFFLTYAVYLQSGLQRSVLQAAMATLPLTIGYFFSSVGAAKVMHILGTHALSAALALEAMGVGIVLLAVRLGLPDAVVATGLAATGLGLGVAMPSLIRVVVSGVDEQHAGLASGVVITALQISAALGVALIGGVFYGVLGQHTDTASYTHAFMVALACNVAALACMALLATGLGRERRAALPIAVTEGH